MYKYTFRISGDPAVLLFRVPSSHSIISVEIYGSTGAAQAIQE